MTIVPVIMCGGSGTRLWPASRPSRPKQFIPLIGERSTFQNTVLRLSRIRGGGAPLIVAGAAQSDWVRRNLGELNLDAEVLLEPEARDSAAAVAAAAAWVAARDPDAILAILAADHQVDDADAFARSLEQAAEAAAEGWVVTLGVKPTHAATAYGYISADDVVLGEVLSVAKFVEKPTGARAQELVDAGCLWNSGNFIARASTLLTCFEAHAPEIGAAARAAVSSATATPGGWLMGDAFRGAPRDSFDFAVMEKTTSAAVLPIDFAWSDLGAWDAIWQASSKDPRGNAVSGPARLLDVNNSLVRIKPTAGPNVTVLGLSDVAVIGDDRDLLILSLGSSQAVKSAAEQAAAARPSLTDQLTAHASRCDRWLRASALPLWWSVGADHDVGGYFDLIDLDGRPVAGPRRARVQARQSFVFAQALRSGAPGPWASAAAHGLEFMRAKYRRPDGLFRTSVNDDGSPADDDAYLYDQAFFLMASATFASVGGDRTALRVECEALLAATQNFLSHPAGGFREAGAQPFQANAHMHLLEACLAWIEAGGDGRWAAVAEQIVALALSAFIDHGGGFLREFFDADWRPKPGRDGRLVEPGHQFEWAWLLARWGALTGSRHAADAAVRLFAAGVQGVDLVRGVAVDELDELEAIRSPRARLWPQTEYLKAAVILAHSQADAAGRATYLAHAVRAADALQSYLEAPVQGLWRDKMLDDGSFVVEPSPASSLYHVVGAINALTG